LYHVTHDDFPGQEFTVAKQSFKVQVGCMNPDNILEDERPPSAPEASFPKEDPNLSHQFKSQLDEDCQPVKWLNYETKALKSTTTTSLSQRMLELILFLLLRELGQISDSAAKT